MLRRAVFAALALGVVTAVACGRQVTPSPNLNVNLAGRMVIKFRTNGPMNFNAYNYIVVFNTTGNGQTPYPNVYTTSFLNYSYAFVVGAQAGGAVALPQLFQYVITPGVGTGALHPVPVPLGPSTVNLTLNDNQQNTEFTITFNRLQLYDPLGLGTPTPGPGTTATPTATPTSGPSPTPSGPTATPSASPTPGPSVSLPPNFSTTWCINFFTQSATPPTVLDSLGIGGATDTSFNSACVDTTLQAMIPIFRASGAVLPPDPASQIAGGEVDNFP